MCYLSSILSILLYLRGKTDLKRKRRVYTDLNKYMSCALRNCIIPLHYNNIIEGVTGIPNR